MANAFKLLSILSIVAVLSACSSTPKHIQLKPEVIPQTTGTAALVTYSGSYFQERFMSIFSVIFDGPLGWRAFASYEDKHDERIKNNEYEELLGDFDTNQHFTKELKESIVNTELLSFETPSSKETAINLVEVIRCNRHRQCSDKVNTIPRKYHTIVAIKMSYGLGMREGKEQIGFAKSYRPFIRAMGIAKRIDTGQVIWTENVVKFGTKAYRGNDANAENIQREELVETFNSLSTDVTGEIVKSLNGNQLDEMPVLFGLTYSDKAF